MLRNIYTIRITRAESDRTPDDQLSRWLNKSTNVCDRTLSVIQDRNFFANNPQSYRVARDNMIHSADNLLKFILEISVHRVCFADVTQFNRIIKSYR